MVLRLHHVVFVAGIGLLLSMLLVLAAELRQPDGSFLPKIDPTVVQGGKNPFK